MEVKCPICDAEFPVGREEARGEIECPKCGNYFRRPKASYRPKKSRRIPGYVWVIAVIVVLNILFFLIPEEEEIERQESEIQALIDLKQIEDAEDLFMELHGTYAPLSALQDLIFLPIDITSESTGVGFKSRYRYVIECRDEQGWSVVAVPLEPGVSGCRSFYLDQSGVVRWERCKSRSDAAAGPMSPEFFE